MPFKCEVCNIITTTQKKLDTHFQTQKHIRNSTFDNTNSSEKIRDLESKLNKVIKLTNLLQKENENLKKKVINIESAFYAKTIKNQNQIKINFYGNENLSYITEEIAYKMMLRPSTLVSNFLKQVHFNEHYPENNNVIIKNKNKNVIHIMNSKGDYVSLNKQQFLEEKIDEIYNYFEENYGKGFKTKYANSVYAKIWQKRFEIINNPEHKLHKKTLKEEISKININIHDFNDRLQEIKRKKAKEASELESKKFLFHIDIFKKETERRLKCPNQRFDYTVEDFTLKFVEENFQKS